MKKLKTLKIKAPKKGKFNSELAKRALYMARDDFENKRGKVEGTKEEIIVRATQYLEFLCGTHPILNKSRN